MSARAQKTMTVSRLVRFGVFGSGVYDLQRWRAQPGGVQQQRDPGISQNRVHEPSPHQVGRKSDRRVAAVVT